LTGEAIPDPVYSDIFETELTYTWSVKQKPDEEGDITIIDDDKATAFAKVTKAGTYVFTFTVDDDGKAASKDVTLVIEEEPDDAYKAVSVVTQVKTAPVLPEQMEILLHEKGMIEWDDINPDSYSSPGSFEVE